MIELNVGIICTCLPSFRAILLRFFPVIFGTTHNRTNEQRSKSGYLSSHNVMESGSKIQDNAGMGITCSKTYDVEYLTKPQLKDSSSFVQLVTIEGNENMKGVSRRFSISRHYLIKKTSAKFSYLSHIVGARTHLRFPLS
jgi:hypothetical protein